MVIWTWGGRGWRWHVGEEVGENKSLPNTTASSRVFGVGVHSSTRVTVSLSSWTFFLIGNETRMPNINIFKMISVVLAIK